MNNILDELYQRFYHPSHHADCSRMLRMFIGVHPVCAIGLIHCDRGSLGALAGNVVSAAVTGKFKENAKPSLLIARCGLKGIVHKLLINLRSPQLLFYFVKWSRKDSSRSSDRKAG